VVDALSDKLSHVPYRDSKLTRLLKASLGGAGKGVLIGCVASGAKQHAEAEAMLQFFAKAQSGVVNKPRYVTLKKKKKSFDEKICRRVFREVMSWFFPLFY
jgi:hypothetical protein